MENVYTQHTPLLVNTLELLMKGRLKEADYTSINPPLNGLSGSSSKTPRMVIVFIVGGSTYEEAKAVADLNLQVRSQITMTNSQASPLSLSNTLW